MSKISVGLIGCGLIARQHAERLNGDDRVAIVACCDPNREAAERLQSTLAPAAEVVADEHVLCARRPLDAVVISSPTPRHYDQACLALESGLHVLCEKPLAPQRPQIVDLIERAQRSGRVFAISHQRRYKAAYVTARRELTERADWYGPVRQIHIYACERWQQTIAGTWRDDPTANYGYFGDAGIHQVDVSYFITGLRAKRLTATSRPMDSRVEIITAVLAELTDGVGLSAHFVGNAQHWREDIHFHCEKADLLLRSEEVFRAKDNKVEQIRDLEPGSWPDRGLIDAISGGKPVVSPPEIALPIYDWTQAVLRSKREKSWVPVGE
ncbi:MAG TPA: Gfo/Idh/MocA family oxidoreductase [Pirellulales bacterium]|jgi:predicted dehydrogenase|nr:Gfo/Idh/MocA family oxidoreductase [Pirellulales bacterium]